MSRKECENHVFRAIEAVAERKRADAGDAGRDAWRFQGNRRHVGNRETYAGFRYANHLSELFDKRVDYIIGTSEDHRSATLTEEEIAQLGEWAVEEDYEDMLRKYALLDDYGKSAVDSVLRTEFNRAQEQGTLNSGQNISVSVKSRRTIVDTG